MRKPILLMKRRGMSGPYFGMKKGWSNLVKSVGNFYEVNGLGTKPKERWFLNFNGTNYAQLSEPKTLAGDYSIEIVFNTSDINSTKTLLDCTANFELQINVLLSGEIQLRLGTALAWSTTVQTAAVYNDGIDHKLLLTKNAAVFDISVDGASVINTTDTPNIPTLKNIGVRNDLSVNYIGTIYSVGINDLTTPSNSISWKLNSGPPVYDTGPEMVTNYNFSNGLVGWDGNSNWGVTNSIASPIDPNQDLLTDIPFTPIVGVYSVNEIETVDYVSGQFRFSLNNTGNNEGGWHIANGIKTFLSIGPMTVDSTFATILPDNYVGGINYVSIKPYLSTLTDGTIFEPSEEFGIEANIMRDDDWSTPPAGITVSGRTATFDGAQSDYAGANANQDELHTGLYFLNYRMFNATVGTAKVDMDNAPATPYIQNGVAANYQNPVDGRIRVNCDNLGFNGSVEVTNVLPVPQGLIYENVVEDDWELHTDIPANAVTYNGDIVTYNGEIVTYGN